MRLATLREGGRDGTLVVIDHAGKTYARATGLAPTLQSALDDWARCEESLRDLASRLDAGSVVGTPIDPTMFAAPLPRAYEWLDGSAFLEHVRLARQARSAPIPDDLETNPLMYQGGSGGFCGPHDRLPFIDPTWGLDFEAELAAIVSDVPRGATATNVPLFTLCNDVTLRALIPAELAKGFGFIHAKPATAFAPFAITPDEMGAAFFDGRVHLRVRSTLNGVLVGDPDAGQMHFSFFDLIAHAARTRALTAGTIIGSGTVSNADPARGVSCLVERRMREILTFGAPRTPYLQPGDTVQIQVHDLTGRDLFGEIRQIVG